MNQGRAAGIILAVFFVGLYLAHSYSEIFTRQGAFLYDPQSDDLYAISMAPILRESEKWYVFVPFTSLFYADPEDAEYRGKLHALLAEFRADNNLLKSNLDALDKKKRQKFDDLESSLLQSNERIEMTDIEYYVRQSLDARNLLSKEMLQLLEPHEIQPSEMLVVDAVVVVTKLASDSAPVIRTIRNAILLKGAAAVVLSDKGL